MSLREDRRHSGEKPWGHWQDIGHGTQPDRLSLCCDDDNDDDDNDDDGDDDNDDDDDDDGDDDGDDNDDDDDDDDNDDDNDDDGDNDDNDDDDADDDDNSVAYQISDNAQSFSHLWSPVNSSPNFPPKLNLFQTNLKYCSITPNYIALWREIKFQRNFTKVYFCA